MRQKRIEIKRLGGRVEEELALRGREGKQIFFHCRASHRASLNTAGVTPTCQPGTFSVHFRVRNQVWVVVMVQKKNN